MLEDKNVQDNKQLIAACHVLFKKGTDYDLWGQPLEAIKEYQNLNKVLKTYSNGENDQFEDDQKKTIEKIEACLELRAKALQKPGRISGISLQDLKKVETNLKNLLSITSKEFPLEMNAVHILKSQNATEYIQKSISNNQTNETEDFRLNSDDQDDGLLNNKSKGSLLPPPIQVPGKTMITLRIEKIGLKDAYQYINPFITISVKDCNGQNVTALQDTPLTSLREESYVYFGIEVFIQKPLEFLPQGFGIFFEFKHYKPKKQMISTKCWAFMEKDEIKEGSAVIELYKKPTDFRRRKINLLTVKPLYLHLKTILN